MFELVQLQLLWDTLQMYVIIFDILLLFSVADCRIIFKSTTNNLQNPQFGTCLFFLPVFDGVAVAFKSRLQYCQSELSLHSTGTPHRTGRLTAAGTSIYQMELVCQILGLFQIWGPDEKIINILKVIYRCFFPSFLAKRQVAKNRKEVLRTK